jgi:hypothetical protein
MQVKPWDLVTQPIIWFEMGLAARNAEASAANHYHKVT